MGSPDQFRPGATFGLGFFPDTHISGQGPAGLIVENPRLTSLSPIWMHFYEIRTYEIATCEMHAYEMHAFERHARERDAPMRCTTP
jgi:hypothetical protein